MTREGSKVVEIIGADTLSGGGGAKALNPVWAATDPSKAATSTGCVCVAGFPASGLILALTDDSPQAGASHGRLGAAL